MWIKYLIYILDIFISLYFSPGFFLTLVFIFPFTLFFSPLLQLLFFQFLSLDSYSFPIVLFLICLSSSFNLLLSSDLSIILSSSMFFYLYSLYTFYSFYLIVFLFPFIFLICPVLFFLFLFSFILILFSLTFF